MSYLSELQAAGLPIASATEDGAVDALPGVVMTPEQERLFREVTVRYFYPEQYAAYILERDTLLAAVSGFMDLPEWSTWTYQEAEANVTARIFNGWNQVQVDAWVDGLPNTVAGMKTGLKQIGVAILAVRVILVAMAKAIVFLRDLVVRFRP
jgi:hypothetical protein